MRGGHGWASLVGCYVSAAAASICGLVGLTIIAIDAWYHLGKQSELFSFHHAGEHVDACDVATGSARGRH